MGIKGFLLQWVDIALVAQLIDVALGITKSTTDGVIVRDERVLVLHSRPE